MDASPAKIDYAPAPAGIRHRRRRIVIALTIRCFAVAANLERELKEWLKEQSMRIGLAVAFFAFVASSARAQDVATTQPYVSVRAFGVLPTNPADVNKANLQKAID